MTKQELIEALAPYPDEAIITDDGDESVLVGVRGLYVERYNVDGAVISETETITLSFDPELTAEADAARAWAASEASRRKGA